MTERLAAIDRDLACAQYTERLADRRRHLAELLPEPGSLPDDHQVTVTATWSLSIELADSLAPADLARPALELASLLDPEGVPEQVFTTPAAIGWMAAAAGKSVTSEAARDALRCLHRLNLATLDPASAARSVRVHAMVQRTTLDQLPDDRRNGAVRAAAEALAQAWPDVERDPDLGLALRASTATLAHLHSDPLWTDDDGGHTVLFRAGSSLGEAGQVAAATVYFKQLHATARTRLGPDHPDTLTTQNNLARWRGEAGDAACAAAAFEQLLADYMRVLGPDHPQTLTTRHNLAYWRGEAGDAAGAAAAFEQLLADYMRVLGPDHPDTLTTRHNLARWRGEAGDAAGAAAAFEQLLADRLRVLGPDHPDTLATRHNLAFWRGNAAASTSDNTVYRK